MVNQCCICGKLGYSDPSISFHRFPKDPIRLVAWYKALGLQEGTDLPKSALVCGVHFRSADFSVKVTGRRFLNPDAVPNLLVSEGDLNLQTSVPSSSPQISIENEKDPLSLLSSPAASVIAIEEEECIIKDEPHLEDDAEEEDLLCSLSPSLSSTLSASEAAEYTEGEIFHPIASEDVHLSMKRQRNPRYIGDIDDAEMRINRKVFQNWQLAKDKIEKQKRIIKTLQQERGRLLNRVANLKNTIEVMKNQGLISQVRKSQTFVKILHLPEYTIHSTTPDQTHKC